ncbi:MAG: serine--tRNA ligase [SAR202 cluster bacterium]|nr:serine--tRNA ligase [SAR202 cluster bacterium]MDP7103181.1 serine--tRNA ligase [SAR202 cluster bacterium]MDP7224690.1 serine--tRNA ligase [SAR202 cluster bacterium]MDP7534211.1 serine--tRNA ligase [SAR202 cluster bacterium]
MISIEIIRDQTDLVRTAMKNRGYDAPLDDVLDLDRQRRSAISEADELRARRNDVSREIGKSKDKPRELIDEMRQVGGRIRELEGVLRELDDVLKERLLSIPNIPQDDAPIGLDDTANIVVRSVGIAPEKSFELKPHWELGPSLDAIDFERGVKLSGSRFYVLHGKGATLQRALITWMLNFHGREHGYTEVYLPYLVGRDTMTASGHLPHFQEEMYHDEEDDLWMLPTAEPGITSLHRDEILEAGALPLYYVAHTPCWRREKFSAGRDTRGIKRVHQFEKVEMYKFVEPDSSSDELQKLVADAESVAAALEIPYRVLELCTGDMSAPAVKAFDVEMWAPGAEEWLEVSSCSNCTDYQARRAMIRYRPERGARPRYVHTLNGSGLGLSRVMIAVLENYQQEDGSIVIPEVLRPYTGFDKIEAPAN